MPSKTTPSGAKPVHKELLSLREAAEMLGVHPSTVRLWANLGRLKSLRTAGGHRRFARRDVNRMAATQRTATLGGDSSTQLIVHSALGRARMEIAGGSLATQEWYRQCDDATREVHRQIGRRLLGLTMSYLNHLEERAALLEDARAIGREYAQVNSQRRLPLGDAIQAFLFFRDSLLGSVLQMRAAGSAQNRADDLQTYWLVNTLTNEVLVAMGSAYQRVSP